MSIKRFIEKLAFNNQLLKAFRFLHFTKIEPEPLLINDEKCLLLAPHPDDETFGCGGLLINFPQNFNVICLTDGRHGGHESELRYDEFIRAMEFYGIESYSFLNIEDRKLVYNYENFSKLEVSDYDIIFLPNYHDQHKDHKAVTVLMQKLLMNKKHKADLKIIFYELWSPLTVINRILDITPVIDKKKQAIAIYKTQHKYLGFMDGIIGLNQYRGMQASIGFAEGYCLIDLKTFQKL